MAEFSEQYHVPVSYGLAEKLYKVGFAVGTPQCITRFESDFVYDGDPEHPKSHKAGEIRMYGFWHRNSAEAGNLYECPTIEMLVAWLVALHGIFVDAVPEYDCKYGIRWKGTIRYIQPEQVTEIQQDYSLTRMEALMNTAEKAVDDLRIKPAAKTSRSEQFL